jgi:hypothetical protein
MDEHRSFIIELAALIDRYWRKSESSSGAYSQPGRLRRLIGWLTPNGGTLILIALLIATQSIWARPFAATNAPGPSATTVNYQGRLADNLGTPLDGSYGMSFALYDAATDGNLMWGPEVHDAVPVSDGLFSVGLGSRTTGGIPTTTWNGDRYLEITVGGETLSPRELIRSVPIAGMALTVPDGAIGAAQIADGAVGASHIADEAIGASQIADSAITEVNVLRRDDSVSNQADRVIVAGWGYMPGNGEASMNESVNFGITFTESPVVVVSFIGSTATRPANIGVFSGDWINNKIAMVAPMNITSANFSAHFSRNTSSFYTDHYYGYSWIAIGTVD